MSIFFLGVVLGIACGVGLINVFIRLAVSRSRHRAMLAGTVAAFAKLTSRDLRKILPDEFFPSWVSLSRQQKLNWLNQELIKIWPYVNEGASDYIRSSFEPVLAKYKSTILSSVRFSKLTLGTIAPQFIGVTIIEGDGSGITMDLELHWEGNLNVALEVKTELGLALPVQIKDIGFRGVIRLIFKPLVEQFPCFGAISYSLREKKKLDFTLTINHGEILSIPGVFDAIEETIRDAIEDSLTWPVRKVLPIIPGDYSDLELKPVGTLEVKLVQARNLTNKDIIGKSDPFAVLYIRRLRDRMKTSKTIHNDLNPIWNEHCEFIVEDVETQYLVVKIYDDDGVRASELIGCAQVRLKELQPGKVKDIWLKLVKSLEVQRDNKDRGQVHLELLYCPYGMETKVVNPFARQFSLTSLETFFKEGVNQVSSLQRRSTNKKKSVIMRGILTVTVLSAEDLPAMDITGKADPFVMLIMKKTKFQNRTRVVAESLNPFWNQTFNFLVEDGIHDMLILEVWDHDKLGKDYIGRCILTLTKVIIEGEYSDSFPLQGAKSGRLNLHLKWTPQIILRNS